MTRWLWILFALTGFFAILVVVEICLYANAQLSSTLYLSFQSLKLADAIVLFLLFLAYADTPVKKIWGHWILGVVVVGYVFLL